MLDLVQLLKAKKLFFTQRKGQPVVAHVSDDTDVIGELAARFGGVVGKNWPSQRRFGLWHWSVRGTSAIAMAKELLPLAEEHAPYMVPFIKAGLHA